MRAHVEKLVEGGFGLARIDGRACFIHGALPGELVECQVIEEKPGYLKADLTAVLESSPHRVHPACKHYGTCGGCDFMHLTYEAQCRGKESIFLDNLKRIGGIDQTSVAILPMVSGEAWGYRCRARLQRGASQWGFFSAASRNVVEIEHCPVLEARLNGLLFKKNSFLGNGRELSVFNGDEEVSFDGRIVKTTVHNKVFFVTNRVFFQSNKQLAGKLASLVADEILGESVLDLYAGVGFFSAFAEQKATVIAVEQNPLCISLAGMHLTKTKFFTGNAENFIPHVPIDTVIVDPPRTGLDKAVISHCVHWKAKRIIYVSCNTVTLARDLKRFSEVGYTLKRIGAFDFYPQTSHLEAVAVLDAP